MLARDAEEAKAILLSKSSSDAASDNRRCRGFAGKAAMTNTLVIPILVGEHKIIPWLEKVDDKMSRFQIVNEMGL